MSGNRLTGRGRRRWRIVAVVLAVSPAVGASTSAAALTPSPLPDYGYELVSPPRSQGQRVKPLTPIPTPAEDELFMQSAGGLPGSGWLDGLGMTYVAQRGERGWATVPISPSGVDYPGIEGSSEPTDWTSDGQQTLWMVSLPGQQNSGIMTPVVRSRQGKEQLAGPSLIVPVGAINNSSQYVGGSNDLRTLVFATRARPALTGGVTDTRAANRETLIVVRRAPDGTFTVGPVAQRLGTAMFPNCAVELGDSATSGLGAVSRDGRRIIFSPKGLPSCVNATQQRVWVKVGDDDPIDISAPQCSPGGCSPTNVAAFFEGASDDGTRVYFSTEQELLDGDGDTSLKRDLFEYTFNAEGGGTLRSVTSSSTTTGAGVTGVSRVSADGSHVYFVANGQPLVTTQNARGDVPVLGDTNLYVYKRQSGDAVGTIAFVGKLAPADTQVGGSGDAGRTVQASDDGRFFTFVSRADVAGDRLPGDTHLDAFRYDAAQDDLRRLWPDAPEVNGAARTAGVFRDVCECGGESGSRNKALRYSQFMSQDGAVVGFSTTEALDPRDQNTAYDGYVWTLADDAVHLVTSGQGSAFSDRFAFVSQSGNSIGVASATGLVPEHTSGQTAAYVLRKGGGFAPPEPPEPPCSGDGCQGPLGDPPTLPRLESFVGPGDVAENAPSRKVRLLKVSAARARAASRTGTLRIPLRVNRSGRVTVSVTGAVSDRRSGARKQRRVGRTVLDAKRAGRYDLRVRLTSRARKTLRWDGKLALRVKAGPGGATSRVVLRASSKEGRK